MLIFYIVVQLIAYSEVGGFVSRVYGLGRGHLTPAWPVVISALRLDKPCLSRRSFYLFATSTETNSTTSASEKAQQAIPKQSYSFTSFVTPMSAKPLTIQSNRTRLSAIADFSSELSSFKLPSFSGNNTSTSDLSREMASIKLRLERLERTNTLGQPLLKPKTSVELFLESLQADTLDMDTKTVQICATLGFFVVGIVIGASMLDRLWLLGGLAGAYWASGAVYKDSRGGALARRLGVAIAGLVRELQEKYNGAVIFYQTGKLAMASSKWWDKYDTRFKITDRVNVFKQLAMERATKFKSIGSQYHFPDQVRDVWKAVMMAPNSAMSFDKEFKVSSTILSFSRGLISTVSDSIFEITSRGKEDYKLKSKSRRLKKPIKQSRNTPDWLKKIIEPKHNLRGNLVDPWDITGAFKHIGKPKQQERFIVPFL